MSWAALPEVIVRQIFGYFDREEHKSLRLISRADSQLATPELFNTVYLSPNTRSFNRARAVATSRELFSYVRSVEYHVGLLAYDDRGFDVFRDEVWECYPSSSEEQIAEDARRKYKCLHEEMEAEIDFQTSRDEHEELRELCEHFVNLNSISIILDRDNPYGPLRGFIQRRTGLRSSTPNADGLEFANLLDAVAARRLTAICVLSESWVYLSKISKDSLARANLTNMSKLTISLYNQEFLKPRDPLYSVESLDALLGASITSNDYTLELDFEDLPYASSREALQPLSQTVFKHHWPRLKILALYGICAMEDDLREFLYKHRTTLTSLRLGDIELLTQPLMVRDPEEVRLAGSIIGLFQWIHDNLALESASISRAFTNCLDESWEVEDCEDPMCIRRKLELWLSRKGPSPVPPEILRSRGRRKLSEALAMRWFDQSWMWNIEFVHYDPWL